MILLLIFFLFAQPVGTTKLQSTAQIQQPVGTNFLQGQVLGANYLNQ